MGLTKISAQFILYEGKILCSAPPPGAKRIGGQNTVVHCKLESAGRGIEKTVCKKMQNSLLGNVCNFGLEEA